MLALQGDVIFKNRSSRFLKPRTSVKTTDKKAMTFATLRYLSFPYIEFKSNRAYLSVSMTKQEQKSLK